MRPRYFLEEALKTRATGDKHTMTAPLDRSRIAQVYQRDEMGRIFHLIADDIKGWHEEKGMIPKRWDHPITGVRWRKVDVWAWFGLTPPTDPIPGAGDFFATRRTAEILGTSASSLAAAANNGTIQSRRFDHSQHLFAASDIEARLEHPLILWPSAKDDPAFTAYVPPTKETPRDEAQDVSTDTDVTATIIPIDRVQDMIVAAIRDAFHEFATSQYLRVLIDQEQSTLIKGIVGKEVRDSITKLLSEGAIQAVLSDKDIGRVTDTIRLTLREVAATRGPELITATPLASTTRLQDRVTNGRSR